MSKGLTLDKVNHIYRWNGVKVPSVTQVLTPLQNFHAVDPQTLHQAAQFGKAVHMMLALWDDGTLDLDSVDPALLPYLDGWRKFLRETKFIVTFIEHEVYHSKLRYAGTIDRIGRLVSKSKVADIILDIKTGDILYPWIAVQLAGYQAAYVDMTGCGKVYRASLRLNEQGNYRLDWHESKLDWPCFAALITVQNWKITHNIEN